MPSTSRLRLVHNPAVPFGLICAAALAAACASSDGQHAPSSTATPSAPLTTLERLVAAYPDEKLDPAAAAWQKLLDDEGFETQPLAVVEFASLKDQDGRTAYNLFVDAWAEAAVRAGGTLLSANDILMPGLEGLDPYRGGVSWVATFPTISAYVEAMLDDQAVAAGAQRRAAVGEAQVLAGPNLVPEFILQLPPNEPASAFPSARVDGKSADELIDALFAVYPAGGADPTEETLRSMIAFEGFAEQRIHFINLYRFNDDPGGGATALGEYNAAALPAVLAHGARPKVLADVTHHLVGPVSWDRFIFVAWPSLAVFTDLRLDPIYLEAQKDRVVSAEQYGNLITVARADQKEPFE